MTNYTAELIDSESLTWKVYDEQGREVAQAHGESEQEAIEAARAKQ